MRLRRNENTKGIKIHNSVFILTQCADDTTIILNGSKESLNGILYELEQYAIYSEESLNETLYELEQYAKVSGLKIMFF